MASQTCSNDLPLSRFSAHRPAQVGHASPGDDDKESPWQLTSHRSPYVLEPELQSIPSRSYEAPSEFINLGPSPAPDAPASEPIRLPSAARFNRAEGFGGNGHALRAPVAAKIFPSAHIAGRAMTLAGTETLTAGLLGGRRSATIAGALLLAGGLGSSMAAIGTAQRQRMSQSPRAALACSLLNLSGLATLAAGGFLRQYGRHYDQDAIAIGAMIALGVGAAETAASGGLQFAAAERAGSPMPSQRRALAALWALDAGVVTTMTYGLATRLNRFPAVVDSTILGCAYMSSMVGIVWQYADGAWFKRSNVAISPALKTTWVPTAMVSLAFISKLTVLIGIKLAVDGWVLDNIGFNAAGTLLTILSFVIVCVPQLSYFHPDLKKSQHARPWPVTSAVILGAVMLAVGSGIREWAALHRQLPLARGAMAIAGVGALSVVACSSLALAASEIVRGRAPMRHRPEVALALQSLGIAVGVAYGPGIRVNQYNAAIDDVMLTVSYLAVAIGGAMSYASSQLDRAALLWVNAEAAGTENIALEPVT